MEKTYKKIASAFKNHECINLLDPQQSKSTFKIIDIDSGFLKLYENGKLTLLNLDFTFNKVLYYSMPKNSKEGVNFDKKNQFRMTSAKELNYLLNKIIKL